MSSSSKGSICRRFCSAAPSPRPDLPIPLPWNTYARRDRIRGGGRGGHSNSSDVEGCGTGRRRGQNGTCPSFSIAEMGLHAEHVPVAGPRVETRVKIGKTPLYASRVTQRFRPRL